MSGHTPWEEIRAPCPMQRKYAGDPWRLLVGCVCLNRATWRVARPVLERIFERWPSPAHAITAPYHELTEVLQPLGLQNERARRIRMLSNDWASLIVGYNGPPPADKVAQIHGVGKYALDSYRIFVLGESAVFPEDKALKAYAEQFLPVKLWHDDIRPAPDGWVWARTNKQAEEIFLTNRVVETSLDHDLGLHTRDPSDMPEDLAVWPERGWIPETGEDLARWLAAAIDSGHVRTAPVVTIHSWNPPGAKRMARHLNDVGVDVTIAEYKVAPGE